MSETLTILFHKNGQEKNGVFIMKRLLSLLKELICDSYHLI